MPTIRFTQNLQRHVNCPTAEIPGATVNELLECYFQQYPQARGYAFDDQGRLRQHIAIFIDGLQIADRTGLSDTVPPVSTVDVVQALSGGATPTVA